MKVMEKKGCANARRSGKRVERGKGLRPAASVQESQNCDEADAGRLCEAVH